MSYICEFCSLRPENCACSIDLTEPRLETELAVADNMMAAENPVIQRPYGLVDAPSPADFFSLLVEMERQESKYDTPPSSCFLANFLSLSFRLAKPVTNLAAIVTVHKFAGLLVVEIWS